ncbi:hypothetical protein J8A87_19665 [Vibrio parahaemolyticus]|uniref:Uncharacterized protein n=1 Tax=Vibrio vulnificus TaxID=672 RepID=A0AAN1PVE2_VIBVL|nr:hypothetical protein [Vibrio vulnificus]AXX63586.1 hypothetical protein FORC53_5247 [Vibrio vulnificus]KOF28200.1 hypothetical protein ACX13_16295 [Vibrio parahaemolyticus]MCF9166676.1 hypothetical protein [Vibrio parahaemolyticus]
MSLYLQRSINRISTLDGADTNGKETWELIDSIDKKLNEIASKYGHYFDRCSIGDHEQYVLVLHDKRHGSTCVYSGESFSYEQIEIPDNPEFLANSEAIIAEINACEELKCIHGIQFDEPQKRIFVFS